MNRLTYGHFFALISLVSLTAPAAYQAQNGFRDGEGHCQRSSYSSIPIPNSKHGNVDMSVVSEHGSTVRLTLSGATAGSAVIRVPLQVRSNTGFRISGTFESSTARLAQLSVMDVRATGRLVSPEAVDNLEITPPFDLRGQRERNFFGRRRECFLLSSSAWTTCFTPAQTLQTTTLQITRFFVLQTRVSWRLAGRYRSL